MELVLGLIVLFFSIIFRIASFFLFVYIVFRIVKHYKNTRPAGYYYEFPESDDEKIKDANTLLTKNEVKKKSSNKNTFEIK